MINVTDKYACCGCNACVQGCPKQCITMHEDEEGFLYPQVDIVSCVDCGLCEKVCPILKQNDSQQPLQVFAVKNNNETQRLCSSSGGFFILLAEQTIKQNGVVFGACFDKNWEVEHRYAETLEELEPLMRSKYVQSKIGNTYKEAEQFLKQGRQVLFVGTPCQIAGLQNFLRKDYENLLAVDIVCHGVPSPQVWRKYLYEVIGEDYKDSISSISFRHKSRGWTKYSYQIDLKSSSSFTQLAAHNLFQKGFVGGLYLRPSCHRCLFKKLNYESDITLGDFWGIKKVLPDFFDDAGVSLIIARTNRGVAWINKERCKKIAVKYGQVIEYNPSINIVAKENIRRKIFFLNINEPMAQTIGYLLHPSFVRRNLYLFKECIKLIL